MNEGATTEPGFTPVRFLPPFFLISGYSHQVVHDVARGLPGVHYVLSGMNSLEDRLR
jgi:hypothetical protein